MTFAPRAAAARQPRPALLPRPAQQTRFELPAPESLGISLWEPVEFPLPDALGIAVE